MTCGEIRTATRQDSHESVALMYHLHGHLREHAQRYSILYFRRYKTGRQAYARNRWNSNIDGEYLVVDVYRLAGAGSARTVGVLWHVPQATFRPSSTFINVF